MREGGIPGFVVRLSAKGFGEVERVGETQLRAGTATPDKRVASAALDAGIGGFHFYHGIPGGIGGALRMNAGANGVETRERVVEVRALDRKGELHILSNADMGYAYRHSGAASDLIFTSALFEGMPGERPEIQAAMDAVQHHRETVQPIREKTGGSTFKNPEGSSAWKEIDAAGGRGLRIGGAQMSPMHCNFMINTGTADRVRARRPQARRCGRVCWKTPAIRLHWEIKRLGQFHVRARRCDEFHGAVAVDRHTLVLCDGSSAGSQQKVTSDCILVAANLAGNEPPADNDLAHGELARPKSRS